MECYRWLRIDCSENCTRLLVIGYSRTGPEHRHHCSIIYLSCVAVAAAGGEEAEAASAAGRWSLKPAPMRITETKS